MGHLMYLGKFHEERPNQGSQGVLVNDSHQPLTPPQEPTEKQKTEATQEGT